MLLQRLTSPFFFSCWLLASACTVGAFWHYELTSGVEHPIPKTWPVAAKMGVRNSGKSLLMFVHPHCGCTQAGLRELQSLLEEIPAGNSPSVTFVLLQPNPSHPGPIHRDPQWNQTATEAICRTIPGSHVLFDPGGVEARRFGVTTSGTCLLYSASGSLLFSGGLTPSRGHSGPNRGRDLLTQCLRQGEDPNSTFPQLDERALYFPTFGCPLFSAQDQSRH